MTTPEELKVEVDAQKALCDARMKALGETVTIRLDGVITGISEIKKDIRDIKEKDYVTRDEFIDACKDIKRMKVWISRLSGGLVVVIFIIELFAKILPAILKVKGQ